MNFRIVTKHGMTIDITPLPPDFNFVHVCAQIVHDGAYRSNNIWIAYDCISFLACGEHTVGTSVVLAPTTQVKQ